MLPAKHTVSLQRYRIDVRGGDINAIRDARMSTMVLQTKGDGNDVVRGLVDEWQKTGSEG